MNETQFGPTVVYGLINAVVLKVGFLEKQQQQHWERMKNEDFLGPSQTYWIVHRGGAAQCFVF